MNAERTEQLMRQMRERALAMIQEQDTQLLEGKALAKANQERLQRIEEFKKLYFNAGRWAGGARDYPARQAFELMNKRENENR